MIKKERCLRFVIKLEVSNYSYQGCGSNLNIKLRDLINMLLFYVERTRLI